MSDIELSRVWFDWNNLRETDGTYRAVWRLNNELDYPRPADGAEVAIGSEDAWYVGRVERTLDKRVGWAWVRVDFNRRLAIDDY